MIAYRIVERPAFEVIGKKTWIAGADDSEGFGRFWGQCHTEGLLARFDRLSGSHPGLHTGGVTLGISRVEQDPARREFFYMIAIEKPENCPPQEDLETYRVPATQWTVFECRGKVPESIIQAEIFAFMEWLPAAPFVHASAPEMEVYPPESQGAAPYCEFWLPVRAQVNAAG